MAGRSIPVPDYIAFDIETTGFSPDDDRIIEVALVRFENGLPVERWTSLVHPGRKVGLKIIRLTGISREELAQSPDIALIRHQVQEFRGQLPLVGHNPEFDVSFLSRAIQGFPGVPVYDTLELARMVYPGFKTYRLGDLARGLGIPLDDAHRACDDAEATGKIFGDIQKRIIQLPAAVREKIIWIMGEGWASAHLFDFAESPGYQLSLFESMYVDESRFTIFPAQAKQLSAGIQASFDEGESDHGPVAWLPGLLEGEQNQVFVSSRLDKLVLGKMAASLEGYVASQGRPVLVAGDVEVLAGVNTGAQFLSVPGDYLCLLKAGMVEGLARDGLLDYLDVEERRFLSTIALWRNMSRDGLFREIQIVGKAYALGRELSCSGFPGCQDCCASVEQCFYLKACKSAAGSQVIATTKESCFDVPLDASACIVLGFENLGIVWERKQPRLDLGRLKEALEAAGCYECAEMVERVIHTSLDALGSRPDMVVPDDITRAVARICREIGSVIPGLRQRLRSQAGFPVALPVDPPVLGMSLRRLEYWTEQMQGVLLEDSSSMKLLERGYGDARNTSSVIVRKALWPAIEAKKALLSRFGKVVLASPRAGFASRFEGLRRLYGIEPGDVVHTEGRLVLAGTKDQRGPLLISIDKGHRLSSSEHIKLTGEFLKELTLKTSSNVLCLCPSHSFIRNLNSHVAEFLENNEIAVFAQGVDAGPKVLEHLSEPGTLVLARFGVDIVSNSATAPRILVIPKIPFWPPNTIDGLRQREISSLGKNGFIEVSVLPTVLTLRSYMESLCRVAGSIAVVLLDPKILPGQSRWGRDFISRFDDVNTIVCPPQMGIARAVNWVKDKA